MTRALVTEGGGMRGIFSAGVLDCFLQQDYNPFDVYVGTSAGALNLASYIAGQYRHAWKTITHYAASPQFYNWPRFLRGGDLTDIDWLWDTLQRENPIDVEKLHTNLGPRPFIVTATNLHSGKVEHIRSNPRNCFRLLKASSAIPGLYRSPVPLRDQLFVDGGVTDPIPVQAAIDHGATEIVVIRTHPQSYREHASIATKWVARQLRAYPETVKRLTQLDQHYNETVSLLENPPEGIRIIEIAPPQEPLTHTLSRNIEDMERDYEQGVAAAYRHLTNVRWLTHPEESKSPDFPEASDISDISEASEISEPS